VIGTFRYHDDGRLAEEWVRTYYRSFSTKLGVTTMESVRPATHSPFHKSPVSGARLCGLSAGEATAKLPLGYCKPPSLGAS
jgi:hypothetical protein